MNNAQRNERPAPESANVVALSRDAKNKQTILVVEDDPLLINMLQEVLEAQGYQVFSATNAKQALHYVENREQSIHLIFSDIRIPGGISGYLIAQRAKQLRQDIKILLTTGFAQEYSENAYQEEFPIIQKPYFITELTQTIHKLFECTSV